MSDPVPDQPCARCRGDLADHILAAGPNGGPDEYRCLRDEIQDVLADMESSDPPVEPGWLPVLQAAAVAYERSLFVHEGPLATQEIGPLMATRQDHRQDMADMPPVDQPAGLLASEDTATVYAIVRDVADLEPVAIQGAPGHTRKVCTQCDARSDHHLIDVAHRISCPWARAVQIVGRASDG